MRSLTKLTIVATTMLITIGVGQAHADVGVDVGASSSIQSNPVVTGATPEKLMDEDAARNDTGFDLGAGVGIETEASGNIDAISVSEVTFGDIDTDKDGQISEEQFSSSIDADISVETFAEFDKDKDGQMSEAEYQAYLEAETQTDLTE